MRTTGGIVIIISSLLLAGCTGTAGDPASPDSTVSVEAPGYPAQTTTTTAAATTAGSATTSAASGSTSPATTTSSARFTTQVVTATATVTPPPSTTAAPGPAPAPTPSPTRTAAPAAPTAAPAVDASAYGNSASGHFFASPSGRLRCGILSSIAGCQATVVVPDLPECNNTDVNGPIVTVDAAGATHRGCSSEGIFFGDQAKVLPYGATLQVDGFTCTSSAAGVRCTRDGSGRGIRASQQSFGTF